MFYKPQYNSIKCVQSQSWLALSILIRPTKTIERCSEEIARFHDSHLMFRRVVDTVCAAPSIASRFKFEQMCCCSYWFLSICLWLMYNLCLCTKHAANVKRQFAYICFATRFLHTQPLICVWQILMPFIEYFIFCLANNIASTGESYSIHLPTWLELAFTFANALHAPIITKCIDSHDVYREWCFRFAMA